MNDIRCLLIYAAKPTAVATECGPLPSIQFALESGEEIVAVMSGEGMAQFAKNMERFLAEYPALAATKSIKPQ